jgi:tetratricopeptide (TPR) repeat protein
MATVDGRIFAAFRSARQAYDEHERVLALDPQRKDAGLIVGTYRYLVSTLWAPTRLVAYVAGFGGGRDRGIALLEGAATYPSDAQTEAKLGLVLLYNRERRYDDALRVLADLRTRYPRNRLLWLESAATQLRAKRADRAEFLLAEAVTRFANDARPRAFGETALWHYTRGVVRLQRGDPVGARASLTQALTGDARTWVRARTHLALGTAAERTGDRISARSSYDTAARLGNLGRDPTTVAEARRLRARLVR